jgi:hypothetical protein
LLLKNKDGWFRPCEEERRGNLFVFSFNSKDYHVIRSSFLVMTVGFVIARRYDVAICLFLVLIMRLPHHSCLFPRNDGWFRHCEEVRRGNLFVFSFNHEITTSFLVMTVKCVIARSFYVVAICLLLSFNSKDYFGYTSFVMTGTYFYETQKNQYYFITVVLVFYSFFKK